MRDYEEIVEGLAEIIRRYAAQMNPGDINEYHSIMADFYAQTFVERD